MSLNKFFYGLESNLITMNQMSRLNKKLKNKKRHMYTITLSHKMIEIELSRFTKLIPSIPPSFSHVLQVMYRNRAYRRLMFLCDGN